MMIVEKSMANGFAGAALAAVLLVTTNLAFQSTQDDPRQPNASPITQSNPATKPTKIYDIGGDVKAPHVLSYVRPSLDEQQIKEQSSGKKAVKAGTTIVKVIVGDDGTVLNARVVQSFRRDVDIRAIEAVKQWKFEPAQKKGVPVAVEFAVPVDVYSYR